MATQRTATIYITNKTDGNAWILLYHMNSSNGTQRGSWNAGPGQTVGPMTVYFETGIGTGGILDYWSVMLNVSGGFLELLIALREDMLTRATRDKVS